MWCMWCMWCVRVARAQWELAIPSELGYGEMQRGQYITPGAVLVFDVELVSVVGRKTDL